MFIAGLAAGRPGSGAVQALLTVAREDPAAFTLLWRHAVREPQFSAHAATIRGRGVRAAEGLLATAGMEEGRVRAWAAETIMSFLVASVLHWLEEGDEVDDDAFVDRVTRSLAAMVKAWNE
jgi:hypothetical protein